MPSLKSVLSGLALAVASHSQLAPASQLLSTSTAVARDAIERLHALHLNDAPVSDRQPLQIDLRSSEAAFEALSTRLPGAGVDRSAAVPGGLLRRADDLIRQCATAGTRSQPACEGIAPVTVGYLAGIAGGAEADTLVITAVVIQWKKASLIQQPGYAVYLQYRRNGSSWRFDRILRINVA